MPKSSSAGRRARVQAFVAADPGASYARTLARLRAELDVPGAGTIHWIVLEVSDPGTDEIPAGAPAEFGGSDASNAAFGCADFYRPYDQRSPDVMVYPQPREPDRLVLLARLAFREQDAECDPSEVAYQAGHQVLMRHDRARDEEGGRARRRWRYTARPATAAEREDMILASPFTVPGPPIAERAWCLEAVVRYLEPFTLGGPYTDPRPMEAGRFSTYYRTGRKDRPVDLTHWQTNFDVDLMSFIPSQILETVEVLSWVEPFEREGAWDRADYIAQRWRRAHAFVQEAVAAGVAGDELEALFQDRAQATREVRTVIRYLVQGQGHDARSARVALELALEVCAFGTACPYSSGQGRALHAELVEGLERLLGADVLDVQEGRRLIVALDRAGNGEDYVGLDAALFLDVANAEELARIREGRPYPRGMDTTHPAWQALAARVAPWAKERARAQGRPWPIPLDGLGIFH